MNETLSGLLTIGVLVVMLAVAHVPLGNYMARVYTTERHLRPERWLYRLAGADPAKEQNWKVYAASVGAFSLFSIVLLFLIIVAQGILPFHNGETMHIDTAVNTAISFVTNTNWQSYAGEAGTSISVQAVGLTVQNFASAAVGIAVVIALIRAFARHETSLIGNFWVDLVRTVTRILLPIAVIVAVLLVVAGVVQNLAAPMAVTGVTGGAQSIPGGLVASQEAIKELGTNGGGFFNANSAHPFENPNALTNLFEIFLLLVIPFSLPRTYGVMVGDKRQGWSILGFMAILWGAAVALVTWAEVAASSGVAGSMEGRETRFGIWASSLFAASTTSTSTGAVNSLHDSYSGAGGAVLLLNMMLGEISPGGTGSGLYGALVVAIIAVFIAGLMVGRTPEFLGKTIGRYEITLSALYTLVTPALVLVLGGLAISLPVAKAGLLNSGPHGLTEMIYAFTSAANNNGSAFAGLTADQPYLNLTLALAMLLGRFVPMLLILALAGRLVAQKKRPATAGTMPTHTPLFVSLLVGVALIVTGLTYFPTLALGPIAEALS
ncbi:potassium-transporting ATPase subunit KdpA [Lapillicoccus sp.]|uniref:potassium-transporting ATPase subunit KdpA n=1 Tax=Lapillicoccus sp. TaxID=1909287 RepID=UPI0025DA10DC|nr:potassium-transporting ATPase subunit KdpA [Lapillicoccus sp.]